jgi:hypothetical protein
MSVDHIRYDLLTQQALRAVVRRVLSDVAKGGTLPGEHHFYVTFDTRAPGVRLSARMREQYPEEMTIVLQHQFWDLAVTEAHFEVGLSFNGISEKLHVPLEAIKGFFDPSVQFGLQFETVTDGPREIPAAAEKPAEAPKPGKPRRKPAIAEPEAPAAIGPATPVRLEPAKTEPAKAEPAKAESAKTEPAKAEPKPEPKAAPAAEQPEPDKPSGGAEVVRLDRFRKK